MPKIYIVTGGAGFIGSHLARRLVKNGAKVFVLDDLSTGFKQNVPKACQFYKVDLSQPKALAKLKLPKIDAVFHFAGQSSGEASFADPLRDVEVNYTATFNTLQLAQRLGCKRFFFASSMSTYGAVPSSDSPVKEDYPCSPVSYYGANKLASEKMIRIFCANAGIKFTVFRLFNVYGPGQNMNNMKQGMVSIYLAYLMKNKPVLVKGSLDRFRDFIYVDDVVDVCLKSLNNSKTYSGIFNLGTSTKTTVKDLLKELLRAYGKVDFNQWVNVKGHTSGDVQGLTADISRLKRAIGWKPKVNLAKGVDEMKQWLDTSISFWKG